MCFRMTMLLGPLGCGKTTLLKALAGKTDSSLKVTGEITYNGYKLDEFVPKETTAYISRVGIGLIAVEVRYEDLCIEAECEIVHGKPIPSVWNTFKSTLLAPAYRAACTNQVGKIRILNNVRGVLKPGRMTLLLGPPGCGKSTLLKALAGKTDSSLRVTGEVTYNGYKLDEFVLKETTAYISQYDLHICELTILGLDTFADTIVEDAMIKGISGVQKRRLITGGIEERSSAVLESGDIPHAFVSADMFAKSFREFSFGIFCRNFLAWSLKVLAGFVDDKANGEIGFNEEKGLMNVGSFESASNQRSGLEECRYPNPNMLDRVRGTQLKMEQVYGD
ncbi:hypothetical protein MLD38_019919 [Melastoma candidum]|uniref:Uncharacterized protein n=1 Tax=Melastoma candidum TaxID=119954 RepID=A0ACB9QE97_9MYRT|nr:hypothetical protein MLD38_019919 [Melastoma candidum]